MRTFQAVTTFTAAGRELYGERMTRHFREYWAWEVHLAVYSEGFNISGLEAPTLENRKLPAWIEAFKDRHANSARANGRLRGDYDYRWDAFKFSNKSAAVLDAAMHASADVLIWLDGDVTTHAPVTLEFLESLLPPDAAIAWLDRERLHPETGFYMLDLRHPGVAPMLAEWRRLYEADEVFKLREWHDAFVLNHLVESAGLPTASLSGEAVGTSHPLARGPLAAYFDHLKGNRKSLAHSPEHAVLA